MSVDDVRAVEGAARVQPPAAGAVRILRRLGWGVVDQAVSSLSNFALSIVVARSLGAERFGAFTLAYVSYALAVNAARGLATDPFLVRHSGAESPAWRRAAGSATATATAVGVVIGIGCVVAGLLLPDRVGPGFIALGVGLPGLMLQDSWRFVFFSSGRGDRAVVNDTVWGVLLLGGLGALLLSGHSSLVGCVLVFGATASVAAGVGYLQCRIRPAATGVRGWVVEHRALGLRYLTENVSIGGARQVRLFAVGGLAGLVAVGDVRGAEVLMGPFLVILMGVSQVAVPEAAHVLRRSPHQLLRFCFALGAVQAVAAAVWGLLVALLPLTFGEQLLGAVWEPASALLLPVTIGVALACFSIGAAPGLRAMGAAPRSLTAQLTASALYVVGGGVGVLQGGALGSCWGVAVATALGTVVWWWQLRRGLADHLVDHLAEHRAEHRADHPADGPARPSTTPVVGR